ncbi:MAG: four helix bundle protein [Candidatus Omnitrophica bacterium]|nr:four helix bundle protein [Candidatus Omnitrophota bacterium]MBU1925963.1 four helix bundle protein [Candidatus Omnitrophota bacterium]
MEKINSFKQLKIWQKGIEIVKDIYRLTKIFPKEELYNLTSQMRRSAVSIPSNIAEGFKRYHNKEYSQFLHIVLGSTAELETQLIIAKELSFIDKEDLDRLSEKANHLSRMIAVLLKKLK